MQKRKTLLNGLTNNGLFGTKEEIEQILLTLNINPQIRAEKLRLNEFASMADKFDNLRHLR